MTTYYLNTQIPNNVWQTNKDNIYTGFYCPTKIYNNPDGPPSLYNSYTGSIIGYIGTSVSDHNNTTNFSMTLKNTNPTWVSGTWDTGSFGYSNFNVEVTFTYDSGTLNFTMDNVVVTPLTSFTGASGYDFFIQTTSTSETSVTIQSQSGIFANVSSTDISLVTPSYSSYLDGTSTQTDCVNLIYSLTDLFSAVSINNNSYVVWATCFPLVFQITNVENTGSGVSDFAS